MDNFEIRVLKSGGFFAFNQSTCELYVIEKGTKSNDVSKEHLETLVKNGKGKKYNQQELARLQTILTMTAIVVTPDK